MSRRVRQPGSTLSVDPVRNREWQEKSRRKGSLRAVKVERDWADARRKVEREGTCRICGAPATDAAHVIGRECDRPKAPDVEARLAQLETLLADGEIHQAVEVAQAPPETNAELLYVAPDAVWPACRTCHDSFDGRPGTSRIDILHVLTLDEQARAVLDAGGVELMRMRTAPSLYLPSGVEA